MSAALLWIFLLASPVAAQAVKGVRTALAAPLMRPGFAVIGAQNWISELKRSEIVRAADALTPGLGATFQFFGDGAWRGHNGPVAPDTQGIATIAQRIAAELSVNLSLESELEIDDNQIRVQRQFQAGPNPVHVDGGYLTIIHASRGPGPVVFQPDAGGKMERIPVPEGGIVVLTGIDREIATGIPSTLHSPTLETAVDRIVWIIRLRLAGLRRRSEIVAAVRRSVQEREESANRALGR